MVLSHAPSTASEDHFELIRTQLHTPVIGDVLDTLGRRHQFLPQRVRPLRSDMVLVGRAMPVLLANVFDDQKHPFGRLTEALDQLQPGDVYLAGTPATPCAAWGELLTAAARGRGAAGAVIDGFLRDTRQVLGQEWPVFSQGSYGQDARIRSVVLDYRVPIEIGHVRIMPGDLVVGDIDGVVIVPRDLEEEVVKRAVAKVATEDHVRRSIGDGMSTSDAFAHYGVL